MRHTTDTLTQTIDFSLEPQIQARLINLCGENDCNIRQIAHRLGIRIHNRGFDFRLTGEDSQLAAGRMVIESLYQQAGAALQPDQVHLQIIENRAHAADVATDGSLDAATSHQAAGYDTLSLHPPHKTVRTRNPRQKQFVEQIRRQTISFGTGPAGTGKTYIAVACAAEMLIARRYERLVITRPAVEAGEKLGFLPGGFSEKVDPYLRPVFDALYETMGQELTDTLISRGVIEIAPLAFMRGRSFHNAFALLDEGQNTSIEQMKMFLTRMGFGSQLVITGDPTQVDLPASVTSGLSHAVALLEGVPDIYVTRFVSGDIIRHPLIQSVVQAYASDDQQQKSKAHFAPARAYGN